MAALACAAVAALAMPAAAVAKADPVVHPGSFSLEIGLRNSDGWSMSIIAANHRQIYLNASRGAASVTYRVTGHASRRRLKANFGALGRVDLRMDLEPRPLNPVLHEFLSVPDHCRGKEPVELVGPFRGVVDFPGEAKVAGIKARSGPARVQHTYKTVCERRKRKSVFRRGSKLPALQLEVSALGARGHGGGRTTAFEAFGVEFESEILFGLISGSVHERHGRVRIIRSVVDFVEGPKFDFGPQGRKVQTAEVKAPKPFTGNASYQQSRGISATWTGDLAVSLPGLGTVPLAGPEFNAKLCRGTVYELLEQLKACESEFRALSLQADPAELLRGLYGSGSHSQPLALARLSSLR